MTVTITFGTLTMMGSDRLPIAGKRKGTVQVQTEDTLLISGQHSVQTNPNYGWNEVYECMGTWSEFLALLAMIGYKNTLTISGTPAGTLTYTNCAISGNISWEESDNPGYYYWKVGFVRETVT